MLNIFKTLFSVLGGTAGLILRFMLIIALCVIGVFCLGSMLFEAFIWGGVRIPGLPDGPREKR